MIRHSMVCLFSLIVAHTGWSAPLPGLSEKDHEQAKQAVQTFAAKKNAQRSVVEPLTSAESLEVVPRQCFFGLRFPLYPVAFQAPEGLTHSNVLAVSPDNKVTAMTDAKGLQSYLRDHATAVKNEETAKSALKLWLKLTQQFHQDGFYTFSIVPEATKVTKADAGHTVSGRLVVMKGGNGTIEATLTFDQAGRLDKVEEKVTLRPGPRPRCHATKLLHPDPIVRQIVEDDLRYMGRAAFPYLQEQRAKASPELQRAIDRIWKEIENQDR